MAESTPKIRRPRADAERNRQRLLDAAKAVFARDGGEASLEEIAREASVGIGTLYRHFPSRDALIDEVYAKAIAQLSSAADALTQTHAPLDALRAWLLVFVDFLSTKKLMAAVLATRTSGESPLYTSAGSNIQQTAEKLMRRAEASGDIRSGIDPLDILRAIAGVALGSAGEGWDANARNMAGLLVDGLRIR